MNIFPFFFTGYISTKNRWKIVLDMTLNSGEVPVMLELWGMQSTPPLPSLPGSLWPGVVSPDISLSMSQIELNYVLMLNWIAWNRTVLAIKLHTYATLNCLKWNCFCMLNWIVWNRTVFWDWNCVLVFNWIVWNRAVLIFNYM